jgi:hypothetical protein
MNLEECGMNAAVHAAAQHVLSWLSAGKIRNRYSPRLELTCRIDGAARRMADMEDSKLILGDAIEDDIG